MVDRGRAEKAENGATARLRQHYPTIDDLRTRARRRVPRFGFDFVDGGATEEYCIERNTSAFQAIELLPHYCVDGKVTTSTELFGKTYSAPIGVAPMGSAGLMWPGAEKLFAAEAQRQQHPLRAGDARQCLDRGDRRDRAGRVLVSALSLSL